MIQEKVATKTGRKRYSAEFKQQAQLRAVKDGVPMAAQDLGLDAEAQRLMQSEQARLKRESTHETDPLCECLRRIYHRMVLPALTCDDRRSWLRQHASARASVACEGLAVILPDNFAILRWRAWGGLLWLRNP